MAPGTEHHWRLDSNKLIRRPFTANDHPDIGICEEMGTWLAPINSFSRYVEFTTAERYLEMKPGLKTLDIGSPKVFSLVLAERFPGEYWLTDIWENEVRKWEAYGRQGSSGSTLHFQTLDARNAPFPDNHFDRIVSLSVLEHIREGGDAQAMREMARMLAPGGVLVITVPIAKVDKEQKYRGGIYGNTSTTRGGCFFQRLYRWDQVQSRLIEPSNLKWIDSACFGVRKSLPMCFFAQHLLYKRDTFTFWNKWRQYMTMPFSPFFPYLSRKYRFPVDPENLPEKGKYYYDVIVQLKKPESIGVS